MSQVYIVTRRFKKDGKWLKIRQLVELDPGEARRYLRRGDLRRCKDQEAARKRINQKDVKNEEKHTPDSEKPKSDSSSAGSSRKRTRRTQRQISKN